LLHTSHVLIAGMPLVSERLKEDMEVVLRRIRRNLHTQCPELVGHVVIPTEPPLSQRMTWAKDAVKGYVTIPIKHHRQMNLLLAHTTARCSSCCCDDIVVDRLNWLHRNPSPVVHRDIKPGMCNTSPDRMRFTTNSQWRTRQTIMNLNLRCTKYS